MNHIVVALVINYRDSRRTATCVSALLGNNVAHAIIWDNSEDRGASAKELAALFEKEMRTSVIVSETNLGFAAGVNRGVQACRDFHKDAWILLINNDAIAPSDLSSSLVSALDIEEKAMIAFPALLHAGKRLDEVYYHRWLGIVLTRPLVGAFRLPRGCCLMLATDRWVGRLFDEDFFMYGEEIELGWRLRKQSSSMVEAAGVLVVHEGSASSVRNSAFYESRMVAAHLILARKLTTARFEIWLLYVLRAAMLFARAVLRAIRYRSLTPLKALWEGSQMTLKQRGPR